MQVGSGTHQRAAWRRSPAQSTCSCCCQTGCTAGSGSCRSPRRPASRRPVGAEGEGWQRGKGWSEGGANSGCIRKGSRGGGVRGRGRGGARNAAAAGAAAAPAAGGAGASRCTCHGAGTGLSSTPGVVHLKATAGGGGGVGQGLVEGRAKGGAGGGQLPASTHGRGAGAWRCGALAAPLRAAGRSGGRGGDTATHAGGPLHGGPAVRRARLAPCTLHAAASPSHALAQPALGPRRQQRLGRHSQSGSFLAVWGVKQSWAPSRRVQSEQQAAAAAQSAAASFSQIVQPDGSSALRPLGSTTGAMAAASGRAQRPRRSSARIVSAGR